MRFYCIEAPLDTKTYFWAEPKPYPDDLLSFVMTDKGLGARIRYDVQAGRRRPGDVLSDAAWSTQMIGVLRNAGASGFSTYDIDVYHEGEPVSGYMGVCIIGRGGAKDLTRSKLLREGTSYDRYEGVYMLEDDWDGSDVFAIPGMGINIYVTERIAGILTALPLRGAELKLNNECTFPEKSGSRP